MIRRSKMEILMDMLKIIAQEGSIRRTRLMYRANLTWTTFREALCNLENNGLVSAEKRENGVFVSLTTLGYETRASFEKLEKFAASTVPAEQTAQLTVQVAMW